MSDWRYFRPSRLHDLRAVKAPLDPRAMFRQGGTRTIPDNFARLDSDSWFAMAADKHDEVYLFDSYREMMAYYTEHFHDETTDTWYYGTLR